ncbi:MAG: TIGR03905 family TSCPD domain-containing protein [Bacteroidales bacterium]|nr:TIGR03905 family TSCPD domain-containing protein [Bacteroidales bacterium]
MAYEPMIISDRTEGGIRKLTVQTSNAVCAQAIQIEIEGDVLRSASFLGGCHGNTQGVAALSRGMKVSEVIERIEGINCHGKGTSCPDQLAKALKLAIQ